MHEKMIDRYIDINADEKRQLLEDYKSALERNFNLNISRAYTDADIVATSLWNSFHSLIKLSNVSLVCLWPNLQVDSQALTFSLGFISPYHTEPNKPKPLFSINLSTSEENTVMDPKPFDNKHLLVFYNSLDEALLKEGHWALNAYFSFLDSLTYLPNAYFGGSYWKGDIRQLNVTTDELEVYTYYNVGLLERALVHRLDNT